MGTCHIPGFVYRDVPDIIYSLGIVCGFVNRDADAVCGFVIVCGFVVVCGFVTRGAGVVCGFVIVGL